MALQRYSVIERLDAGGMAEVFKGKACSIQGIEKLVAIKRILPNLTRNKKFVSMFLDEARLSMTLNHANIVQVFDLGVADNTYFIVMEYVDGPNLKVVSDAARRTGYRIPIHQSIYLMMEVCKALTHAHTKKDSSGRPLCIVHRDVSPPNILLSGEGEVKLTDFGLAKAQSQLENTEPGVVKGKFSYLAPEAAYGEEVDHRSDIFAVGIILWELIAGQRLFLGSSDMETLELVRRCHVPSLLPANADVTPDLEQIVMRALARRVEDRYSSTQEMGDDLAHFIFRRGLKVTSFDISQLVGLVMSGKLGEAPRQSRPLSLIDQLIQGELEEFRSIQGGPEAKAGESDPFYDGSRPLSIKDLSIYSPFGAARAEVQQPSFSLEEALGDDRETVVEGYGLVREPPGQARALPEVPAGLAGGSRGDGKWISSLLQRGMLRSQLPEKEAAAPAGRPGSPRPRGADGGSTAPSPVGMAPSPVGMAPSPGGPPAAPPARNGLAGTVGATAPRSEAPAAGRPKPPEPVSVAQTRWNSTHPRPNGGKSADSPPSPPAPGSAAASTASAAAGERANATASAGGLAAVAGEQAAVAGGTAATRGGPPRECSAGGEPRSPYWLVLLVLALVLVVAGLGYYYYYVLPPMGG